jgi:hypothetical protein
MGPLWALFYFKIKTKDYEKYIFSNRKEGFYKFKEEITTKLENK